MGGKYGRLSKLSEKCSLCPSTTVDHKRPISTGRWSWGEGSQCSTPACASKLLWDHSTLGERKERAVILLWNFFLPINITLDGMRLIMWKIFFFYCTIVSSTEHYSIIWTDNRIISYPELWISELIFSI